MGNSSKNHRHGRWLPGFSLTFSGIPCSRRVRSVCSLLRQCIAPEGSHGFLLAPLFLLAMAPAWAAVDLAPLLSAPGDTVVLDGNTMYSTTETALVVDKTILCNGATIQSTGGPIRASAPNVALTVNNCVIQGFGWALLGAVNGAKLIVQNNTRLTGNGANSCVYVGSSTLELTGATIKNCRWGVNMENADAYLHGVHISNTEFGVQNVAGSVTLVGNSHLQNLNGSKPGAGVSLIASATYPSRQASAVIRDSSFTGFGNAVDIQPTAASGLPAGTPLTPKMCDSRQTESATLGRMGYSW